MEADMKRRTKSFLTPGAALAAAATLAACAPTGESGGGTSAAASGRACFLPSQVNGYNPIDRDTVNVEIAPRRIYQLELLGTCPDVDFSTRIGIRSTHGTSWICQGLDAELIVPGPTGLDRCPVTSVRMLSEAEIAALRAQRRKR
jgi:hypothetical protein